MGGARAGATRATSTCPTTTSATRTWRATCGQSSSWTARTSLPSRRSFEHAEVRLRRATALQVADNSSLHECACMDVYLFLICLELLRQCGCCLLLQIFAHSASTFGACPVGRSRGRVRRYSAVPEPDRDN